MKFSLGSAFGCNRVIKKMNIPDPIGRAVGIEKLNLSKGEPTLSVVNRQLERIAQVFGEEEPPEVNEKTLKVYLRHLRKSVEYP
jgi:hypothetical protein